MRLLPWLLLSVALTPVPVRAQAPVISTAGDPSVQNDSIYRLAVKADDYPDEPFVYLLDDGVARFEADGTGRRTYRQVVQILKQDAVADWAEQQIGYAPGHGRELHIVRRIEGRRGSEPPAHVDGLVAWLRAAARDDAQYVVLERPRRTP